MKLIKNRVDKRKRTGELIAKASTRNAATLLEQLRDGTISTDNKNYLFDRLSVLVYNRTKAHYRKKHQDEGEIKQDRIDFLLRLLLENPDKSGRWVLFQFRILFPTLEFILYNERFTRYSLGYTDLPLTKKCQKVYPLLKAYLAFEAGTSLKEYVNAKRYHKETVERITDYYHMIYSNTRGSLPWE